MPHELFEKFNLPDGEIQLAEKGFANFDLGLTAEQRLALDKLHVTGTGTYNNYAAPKRETVRDLTKFFNNVIRDRSQVAGLIETVLDIRQKIKDTLPCKSSWMSVRAFQRTPVFNMPRWHQDGIFYTHTGNHFKIAMALKGPSTLFFTADQDMRTRFNQLRFGAACDDRSNMQPVLNGFVDHFRDDEPAIPTQTATLFNVGFQDAAIHSEPPISEGRLFLSFVPGTRRDIKALSQSWGEERSTIKMGL